MSLRIVRDNIINMDVEAIVNATNENLVMGSGVSGTILYAAGEQAMREACAKFAPLQVSKAVITPGFNLPSRFVIHAVGPQYLDTEPETSQRLLVDTYVNVLQLAKEHNIRSIAFTLISSGIRGYPKEEALKIAKQTIENFLKQEDMDVFLVLYDKESFQASKKLLLQVESYIADNYDPPVPPLMPNEIWNARVRETSVSRSVFDHKEAFTSEAIDECVKRMGEPFSITLLKLIDIKGKKDSDVYHRANIDRRYFAKIRKQDYHPKKPKILAIAIALELSLDETTMLLESAGYALSHSNLFDVIMEYFIIKKHYDTHEIDQVLLKYKQPVLFSEPISADVGH